VAGYVAFVVARDVANVDESGVNLDAKLALSLRRDGNGGRTWARLATLSNVRKDAGVKSRNFTANGR